MSKSRKDLYSAAARHCFCVSWKLEGKIFCSVVADRTTSLKEEDVAVMTLQGADIRNLCSALENISIYYTLSHVRKYIFIFGPLKLVLDTVLVFGCAFWLSRQ